MRNKMWLPSKLTRPGRLHNAILRPRVLDLLQQAPVYKLVLFRSPAGYGKTTMTVQWLTDKPSVGWYSIDENDNDIFHFINYFIQAINKATNESCPNAQTLVEKRQFSSLQSLFGEVFSELLNYHDECYVVLDDYHLIKESEIHDGIRFFIKHMPDNITLVVTSRSTPPIGTANLRVRDLMIEIDNDLLAFDTEETTRFFNQRFSEGVDDITADNLRTYVEGWPSALQLIALQAQHNKKTLAQSVESVSNFTNGHLWEYLVEEVFDLLDTDTRHFLMQCSILSTFNDILISELTDREDALSMLEFLNRYGLFIYPLEGEQNWFRFHNLFAEFLAHERHARIPQEENELHHKAAKAWLKLDIPHQAMLHAQKGNDGDLLAQIIFEHGWRMFNHGELGKLESAINSLSKNKLYANIKLPLIRAWLAQSQHRYIAVENMLAEAEQEITKRNIILTTNDKGQVNAILAQVAINRNEPEKAFELAELALTQLDSNAYRNRVITTSIVAEVNHVMGQLDRALPLMQQTEKLSRQHRLFHQALWAILQQGEILMAQGFVQAAFELQDSAFKLIEEHKLQQLPMHEFLLRNRAQILWCWNRLDEAEEYAYHGISVLDNIDPSKHLHCYSMLAMIAISRGELDKAKRFVEKIQHLIQQSTYHLDWAAHASQSLLLYWQALGDQDSVAHWLETAIRPKQANNHFLQLQWRNIARAEIMLEKYETAADTIVFLQTEANHSNLFTDNNRNLIIEAIIAIKLGDEILASDKLKQALSLTNQTGMISNFLIDGVDIEHILQKLTTKTTLDELEKHRAMQLLKDISIKQKSRSTHFDEHFIDRLVNHPSIPELVRTSPLTQREWQVLGLIYSGFSNEQVALELDVAGTTIKTHIRNLYQKLNIGNRKEAIQTAENLLKLIGY